MQRTKRGKGLLDSQPSLDREAETMVRYFTFLGELFGRVWGKLRRRAAVAVVR